MKEIDTEAPVVWPAWCYSGNISTEVLKQTPRAARTISSSSSSSPLSSSSPETVAPTTSPYKTTAALALTADLTTIPGSVVVSKKLRSKRKSLFTKKQILTESIDDNDNEHHIVKKKRESKKLSTHFRPGQKEHSFDAQCLSHQVQDKASLQSFHTEKMLSDRMLLSGYNAIDTSKQLCDSSSSAYLFLEKVKNETQMESLKDSELTNNNNVNSSNNNSNPSNSNNNNNNNTLSNNNSSGNCSTNNASSAISNNNSNSNSNTSNNSVKRERLSPGTNGDAQFSISRSRSATPSSFRGTPPQTAHPSNDLQLHNLSTNLLTQIQNRSSDFSTRNYSDFMRSLAAKYNNSNPNDSTTSRRSTFFENNKISQSIKSATNSNANNGGSLKEHTSPSEPTKPVQNLSTSTPSVPPFVQTFLSSLPFSPGVFPPLIDMSSTQALVTLARAAKEAEIKNILMSAQKRTSLSTNNTTSSSPGPNLNAALQQAAQFASPALLYSAQLQQQQQQQQQHQQQSQNRQSSPIEEASANNSGEKHMTASPLDLSSAPPTKRMKVESTSSRSSDKSPNPHNLPGTSISTSAVAVLETPAKPKPRDETTATVTSKAPELAVTTAPTSAIPVLPVRQCQAQSDEVNAWTVDDVCEFVGSIDICVTYIKNFREQCIDGSGLPLLTEDHLMNQLGMKLGPALKLKSMLAKKLGGPCPCVSCSSQAQLLAAAQAAAATVATSSTSSAASTPGMTGITSKNQPHPQQQQLQHTEQFNARNSATCSSSSKNNNNSSSISQTPVTTTAVVAVTQRKNSCGGGTPRPSSVDSGS